MLDSLPIFQKSYELVKLTLEYQPLVPKAVRYTLWQRTEAAALDILEGVIGVSQQAVVDREAALKKISVKLDMLRVFIRLAQESKAIDLKKYATLQERIDEIGRMLGGWLKAIK